MDKLETNWTIIGIILGAMFIWQYALGWTIIAAIVIGLGYGAVRLLNAMDNMESEDWLLWLYAIAVVGFVIYLFSLPVGSPVRIVG